MIKRRGMPRVISQKRSTASFEQLDPITPKTPTNGMQSDVFAPTKNPKKPPTAAYRRSQPENFCPHRRMAAQVSIYTPEAWFPKTTISCKRHLRELTVASVLNRRQHGFGRRASCFRGTCTVATAARAGERARVRLTPGRWPCPARPLCHAEPTFGDDRDVAGWGWRCRRRAGWRSRSR